MVQYMDTLVVGATETDSEIHGLKASLLSAEDHMANKLSKQDNDVKEKAYIQPSLLLS